MRFSPRVISAIGPEANSEARGKAGRLPGRSAERFGNTRLGLATIRLARHEHGDSLVAAFDRSRRFLDLPALIALLSLVHLLGLQDGPAQESQLAVAER